MKKLTIVQLYYFLQGFIALDLLGAVLYPFFTDWGHISQLQIQILQSWFMVCMVVAEVPTGMLADKFGHKRIMQLGACIAVIAHLIYGSTPNLYIFYLGELLFAISLACFSGADEAWLFEHLQKTNSEDQMKNIMGKAHVVSMTARLVGTGFGVLVATQLGLNAPMIISGLTYILVLIILAKMPSDAHAQPTLHKPEEIETVGLGLSYVFKHKELAALATNGVLVAVAAYFAFWLYQPILKSISVPLIYFGFFQAVLLISQAVVAANFERIERLVGGTNQYLLFSAGCVFLGFVLMALTQSVIGVCLFLALSGGFGMSRMQYLSAEVQKLLPPDKRATVGSTVSMYRRFGIFLANPIVGYVITKSLLLPLILLSLLPLLAIMLQLRTSKKDI